MMEPFYQSFLPVSDGHVLAYYQYGNPNGPPILFLHGGPGSGFNPNRADQFAPVLHQYQLISFDQRGSGQSTPLGSMQANTTPHLLADIEMLRHHLGIDHWVVTGSSWGSALALLYAQAYRERCVQLILSSVFLARRQDQAWTFHTARTYFADIFAQVDQLIGCNPAENLEQALLTGLQSTNFATQQQTAYAFALMTDFLCNLQPKGVALDKIGPRAIAAATILLSYAAKDFDLDPKLGVLAACDKLQDLPISLLHGRYDMDCPITQAFTLKDHVPQLDLRIASGNHSNSEEPMFTTLQNLWVEKLL
jgi:proline iminopeptidase